MKKLLYISFFLFTISSTAQTVAAWAALYDTEWTAKKTSVYDVMSSRNGEWPGPPKEMFRYYDIKVIDGALALFQATGDFTYLDQIIVYMNEVRALSEVANRGTWPDGALDWYTEVGDAQVSLIESRGMRNIFKVLWIMKKYPAIRATAYDGGTYQDVYNDWLPWFTTNLWDKWETRGCRWNLRSRTHMASHNAAGHAFWLYLLEDNAATKQGYLDYVNAFNLDPSFCSQNTSSSGMRDQLRTNGPHSGYVWSSVWGATTGYNDVSHSNAEVQSMINMHQQGIEYSSADMDLLITTLNAILDASPDVDFENIPEWIDAVYDSGDDNRLFIQNGWVMLARFDSALMTKLEGASTTVSESSDLYNLWLGNMAYNRAYLDGTLVYPDSGDIPTDTTAPAVVSTFVSVDEGNRFKVETQLSEFATYKIDYGTATGVYTESTTEELTFCCSLHRQFIGGNNGPLLTPGVEIFYRFDMEDASTNQAFSSEYSYTPSSGGIPSIALTGAAIVEVDQNGTYNELGAIWTDTEDGTGSAVVGGDTVNEAVLGTYVKTYNYTDTDTNVAPQVTRTVNVVTPFDIPFILPKYFGISGTNTNYFYLGTGNLFQL